MNRSNISMMILILCGAFLSLGFYHFQKYSFTEGEQVMASQHLPASFNVRLDEKVPTLFLFAHPKCTCTQATLTELSKLKSNLGSKIAVKVFISYDLSDYTPDDELIETQVRRIANVEVEKDIDRKIAQEFGALTSGQTMLYSAEGDLLYQGGITGSRGHEGDNAGVREITRLVSSSKIKTAHARFPTFGCHL